MSSRPSIITGTRPGRWTSPELRFPQAAFQERQPLRVTPRLLPRLLPIHRVMMHEQRAVILLDLGGGSGGLAGMVELVLDEFEVDRRA